VKDAPWFVDFFAPAIEDNLHELHGESIDQNNEDEIYRYKIPLTKSAAVKK